MFKKQTIKIASLLLAIVVVLSLTIPALAAGTTTRISLDEGAMQATLASANPMISADGRYIVFETKAALVGTDTNNTLDVYRYTRADGSIERISVRTNGTQGNGDSYSPFITADGRYIVYCSTSTNLVNNDTNNQIDVFLRDTVDVKTSRVSVYGDTLTGKQANGNSCEPSISNDGRFVAFRSSASNLIAKDTNGVDDIYVRDITGAGLTIKPGTRRISIGNKGEQANDYSFDPVIAANGRYVAFASWARNLISGDTNASSDVFIYDLSTSGIARFSTNTKGIQGNGSSLSPALSADSRYAVFTSWATNFETGDKNGKADIFLYDFTKNTTRRLSNRPDGEAGNGYSDQPSISTDGRYVTFTSYAGDLVTGDKNAWQDVFLLDLQKNSIRRVSLNSNGVAGKGDSYTSSVSADGIFTAFAAKASNIVSGDTNNVADIFLYEYLDYYESSMKFPSNASHDGWVQESNQISSVGGSYRADQNLRVGDFGAGNRQVVSILSFNTSNLPDDAVVIAARIKLVQVGPVVGDPFGLLGKLYVDVKPSYFGTSMNLEKLDFESASAADAVCQVVESLNPGEYFANVDPETLNHINRFGFTQFKLRFENGDNNDALSDYIEFYSGNSLTPNLRPMLEIRYVVP